MKKKPAETDNTSLKHPKVDGGVEIQPRQLLSENDRQYQRGHRPHEHRRPSGGLHGPSGATN